MFVALIHDSAITSPTVGSFVARVAPGTVVTPSLLLGNLVRSGRSVPVHAPPEAHGRISRVLVARGWVEYGSTLFELGAVDEVVQGADAADHGRDAAGAVAVRAETDGTVYLSADPHSPPFVAVGQDVEVRTTLALIEVMKTFTPVRAPAAGVVEQVAVKNGAAVSAGEPLFWMRLR